MRRDDRPTNGQPDAQAMAFRGAERLENLADIAIRQPAALIRYRHTHRVRLQVGGNPKYSILWGILSHRITGIGDGVEQNLLELHVVSRHLGSPSASLV